MKLFNKLNNSRFFSSNSSKRVVFSKVVADVFRSIGHIEKNRLFNHFIHRWEQKFILLFSFVPLFSGRPKEGFFRTVKS